MNIIKQFFQQNFQNQPAGFFVILYTEICELFGQFGISALLVLYLTTTVKLPDSAAFAMYGAFVAMIYIIPLLGSYYAERYLGYKAAILIGIVLMMLGDVLIAIPKIHILYLGLAIFAVGCGFFTPCLTAILGRIYKDREKNRDNAFVLYYIAKNVGVLLAVTICSLVGQAYGYPYAFLVGAVVMLSGLLVFGYGNKRLESLSEDHQKRPVYFHLGFLIILIVATAFILMDQITDYLFIVSAIVAAIVLGKLYVSKTANRSNLLYILLGLLVVTIFSMLLGQGGTTLNLFILRIVDRQIGSITIPAAMFYGLDPFFMLLLGAIVMHFMAKLNSKSPNVASFCKLAAGLAMLGLGFIIFVLASNVAVHHAVKPQVWYVLLAYMIFPVAELAVMPITTSLLTRLAPHGKEALIISFFLLSQGLASYLTGAFSKLANVTFEVTNAVTLSKAALIYQHIFALSAVILFVAALVTFLLGIYSKKV